MSCIWPFLKKRGGNKKGNNVVCSHVLALDNATPIVIVNYTAEHFPS